MSLPRSIQNLITEVSRLPGIGSKSAERLVFYLLRTPEDFSKSLGNSILNLKKNIQVCQNCFNIAEGKLCPVCLDKTRDKSQICVVEDPLDLLAVEKSGYRGLYHVLGGSISPIEGITPDKLTIKELIERIKKDKNVKEIILATNPDLEGESTAVYLSKLIKPLNNAPRLKITRIARGVPVGGDLEYTDQSTLTRALEGRQEY